jgi:ElaB/YqjD/DUF883 family membrane-anchored ribosome-binding protein
MERLDEDRNVRPGNVAAPLVDAGEPLAAEPTVDELKAEISQTQGQLQQTLTEIQERLSPAHLAEQAKNTVRDATVGKVTDMAEQVGQTASRMVEQTRRAAEGLPRPIRNNPWPLALIGVGVAWFLVRSRSQASDDWQRDEWDGGQYGGNGGRQREYAEYPDYRGRSSGPGASTASDVTDRVRDMATDATRRARDLSRDTQDRLGRTMQSNPMVLGAVALAAGALIGTLLPSTDVEDTYMGETRDTLVDSARDIAEDKVQELSKAVRDVAQPEASTPGASFSSPS